MYTVILYWQGGAPEDNVLDPECYSFLFSYAHIQDQVLKRPYTGSKTLCHTVTELNWFIGSRTEWRLILFDGRIAAPDRDVQSYLPPPDTIRREWTSLLLCLLGKEVEGARLEAVPPQEVWYLGCSVRGTYTCIGQSELAYAKLLLTEAERQRFCGQAGVPAQRETKVANSEPIEADTGEHSEPPEETPTSYRVLDVANIPFLRMCWTEVLPDGGICRRQEAFRLCCILLTLAHNDISPSILNSGYLYRVSLELDWERLADCVGRLRQQTADLAEQVHEAWECYLWVQQRTTPYVKPSNLYVPRSGPSVQPEERKAHNLDRKELRWGGESALDRKLRNTHQWLYEQLFFPQNGVYKSLARPIKLEKQNSDFAIDVTGQASIQSELNYAIRDFHQRRQQNNNPLQFEQELTDVERRVRDRVEDRLTDVERRPVQWILAALEGLTFAAFVVHPLGQLVQFLTPYVPPLSYAAKWFGGSAWNFIWGILLFLTAAATVYVLTRLLFRVFSVLADQRAVSCYNSYLHKALKQRGKKKQDTLNFMEYILRYRYHWVLQMRQMEIVEDKKRQKDRLRHHSTTQKNAAAACELLEQLLGEDRRAAPTLQGMTLPRIDFSKEPEQEDYFWCAVQDQICSLNCSGYELDVVFDFITEVQLHKTAELRDLSNL